MEWLLSPGPDGATHLQMIIGIVLLMGALCLLWYSVEEYIMEIKKPPVGAEGDPKRAKQKELW